MNEEDFGAENEQSKLGDNDRESSTAQLREFLTAMELSNSLTAPLKLAIDGLLQLAAKAVGSDEASVLVRDGNEGGLRFLTAISKFKEKLLTLHIPPGKGIAGLVFSSGQPMAVSDVSSEGSFWSEADKLTSFKTVTLLATPLRIDGDMLGVLSFVNRPGTPPYPPFTPEEMDHAAYFATAIARIIEANEIAELVESLFSRSIETLIAEMEGRQESARERRDWVNSVAAAPEHRDMMLLWIAIREILGQGDAERELCRDLLEAVARFTEKRSAMHTSYSGF
jgi:GAF domain-containing protein